LCGGSIWSAGVSTISAPHDVIFDSRLQIAQ
jgi:hypothetical protein